MSPTATYSVTYDILHLWRNPRSLSFSPVLNPASQWGSEEDMPNRPVVEQIGERFGRFDLAVRTSITLLSFIFIIAPPPADPNSHLLPRGYFSPIYSSTLNAVFIH